jgi:hypothetical protein
MTDAEIVAALRRNGWDDVGAAAPIGITGNNHVLRVEADGQSILVKEYFQHPADPRDRFNTERAAWRLRVRSRRETANGDSGAGAASDRVFC